MVPTADRQKATVLVRIGFKRARPADPARHGRQGDVPGGRREGRQAPATPQGRRPTLLVPKAAVRTENGQAVVFVVRGDNVVERRAVRTGGADGDQLEVVAGLTRGRVGGGLAAAGSDGRRARRGEVASGLSRTVRPPEGGRYKRGAGMSATRWFGSRTCTSTSRRGSERIDVLKGVNLDIPAGRFPGADGAVRLGQDDAAQPDGRARHADRRHRSRSTASASTRSAAAGCRAGARSTSASSSSSTTCCRC